MLRIAPALAAFLLLSAPALARGPVESLLEMRQAGVTIQHWDLSCGAAALATLLHEKYGVSIPERTIALAMIGRKEYMENPNLIRIREGFSLLDLKRFVRSRGYEGEGLGETTLADLLQNEPALVPLNLHGYNHFVVFRGLINDRAILADPAYGNRSMSVDRFMDAWIVFPNLGRVAFVVKRPGEPDRGLPLDSRTAPAILPPSAVLRSALSPMGMD